MSHLLFVFAPLLAVAAWVVLRMVGKKWWPLVAAAFAGLGYYVLTAITGVSACWP